MSKILQIAGRELRAYFFSPIAYIVLTAFLFLNGLIFYLILDFYARPEAPSGSVMQVFLGRNVFHWMFFFLFLSVITMRLFAEERRSGTIEVLMTAPVTDLEVVLGKYLGALLFYLVLWAPTLLYVVILRQLGRIDMGPIVSGYLYLVLVGAMFLALGLLLSILTRSQIVAAIASFFLMVTIFVVPVFFENLTTAQPAVQGALSYINTWNHAGQFGKGIVDTRNLLFYLTTTASLLSISVWTLAYKKGR